MSVGAPEQRAKLPPPPVRRTAGASSAQYSIPGVRPSLQNGQLRVSTGNSSIDAIFSGGLQLGSLWLIEEDRFATGSRALLRYFLGEGAVHRHALFVANLDECPREFAAKIPQPCSNNTTGSAAEAADDMRIAFRYNALGRVDPERKLANAAYSFDLTTQIDADQLSALDIGTFDGRTAGLVEIAPEATSGFRNALYARLLHAVRAHIDRLPAGQLLRVCLVGLAGPLWYERAFSADLLRFLAALRALVRRAPAAVCCISMPIEVLQQQGPEAAALVARVRNAAECAVRLESFVGSDRETNAAFREYHGLLHVHRLTAHNTFAAPAPAPLDLAYKLRRRQFVVEKLHLPPDLQENDDQTTATVGCGSAPGSGAAKLDF